MNASAVVWRDGHAPSRRFGLPPTLMTPGNLLISAASVVFGRKVPLLESAYANRMTKFASALDKWGKAIRQYDTSWYTKQLLMVSHQPPPFWTSFLGVDNAKVWDTLNKAALALGRVGRLDEVPAVYQRVGMPNLVESAFWHIGEYFSDRNRPGKAADAFKRSAAAIRVTSSHGGRSLEHLAWRYRHAAKFFKQAGLAEQAAECEAQAVTFVPQEPKVVMATNDYAGWLL